ncbi:MAG TPA: HDOD domain-containing protein [Ignavibacteriaceae bacterium]|nr:HDOD domain-containing protein [Ignavibacteriaceae bacterium]
MYNLPPIPKIMNEALKLLENKSTSTSELYRIISKDQGIVSKILSISNSPKYGLQRRVTSIDFALSILGFTELKNIISVLSLTEAFKNKTDNYLDQKEFWLHSLLTGCAAKRLAEDLEFYNSGEAFIGGFLHDMGVSIMDKYFHTNFVQIHELINKGFSLRDAELEILGMDHQEIGNILSVRWNFPPELCNAILYHHQPSLANQDDKMLAAIIHFADYMTHHLNLGQLRYDENFQLDKECLSILQLKNDEEMNYFIECYKELFNSQIEALRYLN